MEAGYNNLDLDGATQLDDGGTIRNAKETEGKGWYAQAGYLIKNWNLQPWATYAKWDASDDTGSFYDMQFGLSYFFKGHNANIKAGYEYLKADENIGASDEDTIKSFLIGFYVTF
jgi:hypothetical protein